MFRRVLALGQRRASFMLFEICRSKVAQPKSWRLEGTNT